MSKVKFGRDHFKDNEVELLVGKSIESDKPLVEESEFFSQLLEFKNDRSYEKRFSKCGLSDRIGIEMFMFQPNKKLQASILLAGYGGGLVSTSEKKEATNIAKIIKVGSDLKDSKYKEGDLVQLPLSATVGESPNPQWYSAHQYDDSNLKPVQDDLIPKNAPTFVASMGNMAWLPPEEYKKNAHETYTYAIDQDLILGPYAI